MSFETGEKIKISIFGQSHSEEMGVVIGNFPAGFRIDEEELRAFMARRAPRRDKFSTSRAEDDEVIFVSGITNGVTNGAPICGVIKNTNTRSGDYENLRDIPRPGHADFAAWSKFGDSRDVSGGGQFSGRLTAPLCIAGGILKQLLEKRGIHIGAHIASVGTVKDDLFDSVNVTKKDFVGYKAFPVLNDEKGEDMKAEILNAKSDADSIGGSVECVITGIPAGVGNTFFGGWESVISSKIFAIPAVKGIEFGRGFEASSLRGSENNDPFVIKDGNIVTETNNHGGILGGISSGMPILFKVAFKPTPSIGKEQKSVSLSKKEETTLVINGRHDPCIVQRATVCVEAAAAIAVAEIVL